MPPGRRRRGLGDAPGRHDPEPGEPRSGAARLRWDRGERHGLFDSSELSLEYDLLETKDQQRAAEEFAEKQRELWTKAERIASTAPDLDVNGLYRTLKNLERSPSERLRLGLRAARLRRHG